MRCAVGCGLSQRQHTDQEIPTRGDRNHPVTSGLACRRGIDETANPIGERLTSPLVRKDGTLTPVSWDTAIATVVSRLEDALAATRDGVAVLGSGQQTNEAAYALGKLARGGFGTRYYDANTTLCMASAVTAYYQAFGSDAPPPTYDDIPAAQTHLIWGANPAVAHPVVWRWISDSAADADSRLVVVDPVESETATDADHHVQLDPGTDLAFARAVLAAIIDADLVDHEFIEEATTGFDATVASLPPVVDAAETAGVSVETVRTVATAFADPTLVYWGMGVNQSVQGTATARALIDLCLATGNLTPGSGPFSLTGQANSMGTRVCASKGTWPGHRSFTDPDHRQTIADAWGVPVERLPADPGPGPVGIIDAVADGPPTLCWTVATNPVAGMPDASRVESALEETFLVAQDAFWTETVAVADVVLPAATWGATSGTTMNMERRVSRVRAATEPSPSIKQDLDIITTIGAEIDPALFDESTVSPQTVYDELRALTAGTAADISGITYDRLDQALAVRWPAPDRDSEGGYRYLTTAGWEFPTDTGRAAFSTGTHGGLAEPTDTAYPLTLTTGRRSDAYNTGVRSRHSDTNDLPVARIHPDTLRADGAFDGERAVVVSRRGAVSVAVERDTAIPKGSVWLPIHHPAVNVLTLPVVDPESAEPNVKQCAVRLRSPGRSAETAPREL